jgi:heme-degrading monooxygenase HmoA
MIVVLLRSRLLPGVEPDYRALAAELTPLATAIPGYLRHKQFTSEDGERVTIVEYENEEAMRAWARHPTHVLAKRRGRQEFFSEHSMQVCEVLRQRRGSDPVVDHTPRATGPVSTSDDARSPHD